ncbi:MAG: hypothetical protein AAGF12_05160 [Myxococcota bacterium]
MGYEKTEPRTNLILVIAVLTTISLAALQPLFSSYFDSVTQAQINEVQVENNDYYSEWNDRENGIRVQHERALAEGPVPIDTAIARLSENSRTQIPLLAPQPSDDLQAVAGWLHHPDYEAAPTPAPPTPPEPTEEEGSDGEESATLEDGETEEAAGEEAGGEEAEAPTEEAPEEGEAPADVPTPDPTEAPASP